jgi:hypothetical protein
MRLIYTKTGQEVRMGDTVHVDNTPYFVWMFQVPHKPSSSGKVFLRSMDEMHRGTEYYVGVIGAEWIEREDQPWKYPQQLELNFN